MTSKYAVGYSVKKRHVQMILKKDLCHSAAGEAAYCTAGNALAKGKLD